MFKSLLLKKKKAQPYNPLIIFIQIIKITFQKYHSILRMDFIHYKTDNANWLKMSQWIPIEYNINSLIEHTRFLITYPPLRFPPHHLPNFLTYPMKY